MAYRVQYGAITDFESKHRKRRVPMKKKICVSVLIIAVISLLVWPASRRFMNQIVFPWSDTASAVFSQALEEDKGIGYAFSAFCHQVLLEAEV